MSSFLEGVPAGDVTFWKAIWGLAYFTFIMLSGSAVFFAVRFIVWLSMRPGGHRLALCWQFVRWAGSRPLLRAAPAILGAVALSAILLTSLAGFSAYGHSGRFPARGATTTPATSKTTAPAASNSTSVLGEGSVLASLGRITRSAPLRVPLIVTCTALAATLALCMAIMAALKERDRTDHSLTQFAIKLCKELPLNGNADIEIKDLLLLADRGSVESVILFGSRFSNLTAGDSPTVLDEFLEKQPEARVEMIVHDPYNDECRLRDAMLGFDHANGIIGPLERSINAVRRQWGSDSVTMISSGPKRRLVLVKYTNGARAAVLQRFRHFRLGTNCSGFAVSSPGETGFFEHLNVQLRARRARGIVLNRNWILDYANAARVKAFCQDSRIVRQMATDEECPAKLLEAIQYRPFIARMENQGDPPDPNAGVRRSPAPPSSPGTGSQAPVSK
ncbi:MAG: hypothetical protein IH986_09995 [Planctomycetes bacterium]|nr:hypothetical protein [Planctomycetota bacterium]